jgi:mono/diheme cytochrome c family protein
MSRNLPPVSWVALVVALLVPFGPGLGSSLRAQSESVLRPIASIAGKDLYKAYCLQCHGTDGKGDGPRAESLTTKPADLTQIAARNGGKFNRTNVESYIIGVRPGGRVVMGEHNQAVVMKADGVDPMPPWGNLFRRMWPDEPPSVRAGALARYLESIQAR